MGNTIPNWKYNSPIQSSILGCVDSWSLEPARSPKDTWFRIWFEEKGGWRLKLWGIVSELEGGGSIKLKKTSWNQRNCRLYQIEKLPRTGTHGFLQYSKPINVHYAYLQIKNQNGKRLITGSLSVLANGMQK